MTYLVLDYCSIIKLCIKITFQRDRLEWDQLKISN